MAARAAVSREEKELSRRAATPRGINESNKFRGLLKLKFDLRPTGDYARNCLADQRERISESREIRSLSARKVASRRIDISPSSNNTVAMILVIFHSRHFWPYDADPRRNLPRRLLEERDGDKPEVFRNSAGSNQACKRRRLATNEERRSALFTRDWLNLLRRISFASAGSWQSME